MLSKSLGCSYLEADDFHSQANKEKMSKGIPLTDEDRIPWLETLRDAIRKKLESCETVIVTCSALQKKYREILRCADPEYKCGDYRNCKLKFVCLDAPMEVLASRIIVRSKNGKHFMPVSLLQSQLELLQIDKAEGIHMVDATVSLQYILDSIVALLSNNKLNSM
uniref:Gluconokinase n=1 Tax=Gladiolus grandiflorus TaxID=378406 RepID=G3BGS7_9ASPA|nr:gluconokinase 1-like protein [Gladiolus grandiflorus]